MLGASPQVLDDLLSVPAQIAGKAGTPVPIEPPDGFVEGVEPRLVAAL